jgi:hypothetical protein
MEAMFPKVAGSDSGDRGKQQEFTARSKAGGPFS